jgi:hypothetical protein
MLPATNCRGRGAVEEGSEGGPGRQPRHRECGRRREGCRNGCCTTKGSNFLPGSLFQFQYS